MLLFIDWLVFVHCSEKLDIDGSSSMSNNGNVDTFHSGLIDSYCDLRRLCKRLPPQLNCHLYIVSNSLEYQKLFLDEIFLRREIHGRIEANDFKRHLDVISGAM